MPALEFFEGLEVRWQARLLTLFNRLGDTGRISNKEHFSKFDNDFWEFKAFQVRMPCFYRADKRVVITHGFIKKKEGAAPRQEVERAKTIQNEHEYRLASYKKGQR